MAIASAEGMLHDSGSDFCRGFVDAVAEDGDVVAGGEAIVRGKGQWGHCCEALGEWLWGELCTVEEMHQRPGR